MLVSHQYRFIFVKTRKTGGSSAQIALARHMDGPEDIIAPLEFEPGDAIRMGGLGKNVSIPVRRWRATDWYWAAHGLPREYREHMPARLIRRYVGRSTWKNYYTFAIDRNPWDQVISRYFYHFRPERGREKVPFEEFIFSDLLPAWSNWHIYTHRDRIIVDRVIRYDRLGEGLSEVADLLGIPPLDLPQAKGQYRQDRRPYQEWYTPETRDRVAEVFHREIEHFGWTFE